MDISALKKTLHQKIDELNDTELLEALNNIVSNQNHVFKIPEKWLAGIEEGEEDFKEGRFYTLEDFKEKYKKWLKE